MSRKIHTVFNESEQGPVQFGKDVNAILTKLSPLTLVDIELKGTNRGTGGNIRMTFVYDEGGTQWGAFTAVGRDNNAESGAGAALAAMTSDLTVKPRFLRSLTGLYPRFNSQASLLVLYERDGDDDNAFTAWPYWEAPRIVLADSSIAAGATGAASVALRDGLSTVTLQVTNESDITWGANVPGYVYRDAIDKQWHGFPSCC